MRRAVASQRRAQGMSLVELMVAVAISSSLIGGAVYAYSEYRRVYSVSEAVARLQEQARFALGTIEPDVELAGYYGFTNNPDTIRWVRGAAPGTVLATAAALRQKPLPPLAAAPVPAPNLAANAHECGTNFAVDVATPVQGSNNSFVLGPGATCPPYNDMEELNTDTLTLRRAETSASAPEAGRLQIYASRFSSRSSQLLFADGVAPGPIDADNRVHDLMVRAYYVAHNAVDRPGLTALRVKALTRIGGEPAFLDTEVMPGVEDLQVQFGIDSGDYDNDGVIDPVVDQDGDGVPESDGRATRYVNPDFPGLDRLQVVAVRIWLRVRAEQVEPGFQDNRTYRYADVEFTPAGADRAYRRVLVSRTIALRNARTL